MNHCVPEKPGVGPDSSHAYYHRSQLLPVLLCPLPTPLLPLLPSTTSRAMTAGILIFDYNKAIGVMDFCGLELWYEGFFYFKYSVFHNPVKSTRAATWNEEQPRKVSGVIKQDGMEKPGSQFIIRCLLIISDHTSNSLPQWNLYWLLDLHYISLGFFPNGLWQSKTVVFKCISTTSDLVAPIRG